MAFIATSTEPQYTHDDKSIELDLTNPLNQPMEPGYAYKVTLVLATVLEKMAETSVQSNSISTVFDANSPPKIGVQQYLERIFKYTMCSGECHGECYVLALIYIDRFRKTAMQLTPYNIHRIIITSVMLAAKFFQDDYYNNAYYAQVGGVPTVEINQMELDFLFYVSFRLHVPTEEFQSYRTLFHDRIVSAEKPTRNPALPMTGHRQSIQDASAHIASAPAPVSNSTHNSNFGVSYGEEDCSKSEQKRSAQDAPDPHSQGWSHQQQVQQTQVQQTQVHQTQVQQQNRTSQQQRISWTQQQPWSNNEAILQQQQNGAEQNRPGQDAPDPHSHGWAKHQVHQHQAQQPQENQSRQRQNWAQQQHWGGNEAPLQHVQQHQQFHQQQGQQQNWAQQQQMGGNQIPLQHQPQQIGGSGFDQNSSYYCGNNQLSTDYATHSSTQQWGGNGFNPKDSYYSQASATSCDATEVENTSEGNQSSRITQNEVYFSGQDTDMGENEVPTEAPIVPTFKPVCGGVNMAINGAMQSQMGIPQHESHYYHQPKTTSNGYVHDSFPQSVNHAVWDGSDQ